MEISMFHHHQTGGHQRVKISKVSGPYLILILIVVAVAFFAMLRPFLVAILMAAILAGFFYPVYNWIRRRIWNQPAFSSVICIVLVLLLIILPLALVLGILTVQSLQFKDTIDLKLEEVMEKGPGWLEGLKNHPLFDKIDIEKFDWQAKATEGAKALSTLLIKAIGKTSKSTLQSVAMSFIMLYTLFYFLIDGPFLLKRIKYLSPLKDEYEDLIVKKFISMAKATIKGTIIIGVIQGTMGGITLAICGVGSSVFWGTVMVILSIIPGIGAALVWAPALMIKLLTGHTGQGIGILIGGILISMSDNFLRPLLIGKDTQMHALLILFSTLGGIALFGIIGFILGPILAAVFLTVTEIYASEYSDELDILTYGDTPPSLSHETAGVEESGITDPTPIERTLQADDVSTEKAEALEEEDLQKPENKDH
jgi:predicted PurR-regulated permease PerM